MKTARLCLTAGIIIGVALIYLLAPARQPSAGAMAELKARAEEGAAAAQNNLGVLYTKGRDVPSDYAEAARWFRKAAEQGNAAAQSNLGNLYATGHGVAKDYAEAAIWFRKAAEQNNAAAQNTLGALYASGRGVELNYAEAANWFRKAAEQGNTTAENNLGVIFLADQDVMQKDEAFFWLILASYSGDDSSSDLRHQVAALLTPQQVADLEKRAREWEPGLGPSGQ